VTYTKEKINTLRQVCIDHQEYETEYLSICFGWALDEIERLQKENERLKIYADHWLEYCENQKRRSFGPTLIEGWDK
jgi:hypothetical protein